MRPFRFLVFCLAASLWSCATVKPGERIFVNDSDMKMDQDAGRQFSNYAHSIREGATPPGSAKGSGGCGCN